MVGTVGTVETVGTVGVVRKVAIYTANVDSDPAAPIQLMIPTQRPRSNQHP